MAFSLAAVVILCSFPQSIGKASVELFFEAGCPFCLAFEEKILNPLIAIPGVLEKVFDYQGHPFGNAFFVTSECGGNAGYNVDVRKCYEKTCGGNTQTPAFDCYSGLNVCQHGVGECKANKAIACMKAITQNPRVYMPFAHCAGTTASPAVGGPEFEAALVQCGTNVGTPWVGAPQNCYNGVGLPSGDELIKHEAQMTPLHDFVPYITVNGQSVDKDNFMSVICSGYQGPPIPGFTEKCAAAGATPPGVTAPPLTTAPPALLL